VPHVTLLHRPCRRSEADGVGATLASGPRWRALWRGPQVPRSAGRRGAIWEGDPFRWRDRMWRPAV